MEPKMMKCPNCGSSSFTESGGKIVCRYCGNEFSSERYSFASEEVRDKYERAIEARTELQFDNAIRILSALSNKLPECAEIHYQSVLARLGVSFVEEGGQKKVTISRLCPTSVYDLKEVKLALRYADPKFEPEYRSVFDRLEEIRSRFIKIAAKSDPFDVFICFKQHPDDKKTTYTADYEIAKDLYDDLTKKGIRVFFSPVSLTAGVDYEPTIYHALETSKIMLLIAASPEEEFLDAPWVKNEWSRFLSLAETQDKTLVPVLANGFKPSYLPGLLSSKQGIIYDASFHSKLKPILKKYHLLKEKTPMAPSSKKKILIPVIAAISTAVIAVAVAVPLSISAAKKNTGPTTVILPTGENTASDYDGRITRLSLTDNGGGYAITAGQQYTIGGSYGPTNATETYSFHSEDESVATLGAHAVATGVGAGETNVYVESDIHHVQSNKVKIRVWGLQYEKTFEQYNWNSYNNTIETCTITVNSLYFRSRTINSTSSMDLIYDLKLEKTFQDSSSSQRKFGIAMKLFDSSNAQIGETTSTLKTSEFNQGSSVTLSGSTYIRSTSTLPAGNYRIQFVGVRWTDVY